MASLFIDIYFSLSRDDKKRRKSNKDIKWTRTECLRLLALEAIGGAVEAIMALPQSMSYAMLAVLPPVNGLYNQALFPLIFAPFTTAPTIAVGVSAIENLMAGDSVTRLLKEIGTPEERINCASALTLFTGGVFFLMYLCRLGVIASLLPDPVIEGFSTASAFVIGISQIKYAIGISGVPPNLSPIGTLIHCLQRFSEVIYSAFVILTDVLDEYYCSYYNFDFSTSTDNL